MTKLFKNDVGVEYPKLTNEEQINIIESFFLLKRRLWRVFSYIPISFLLMVISKKIINPNLTNFKIPLSLFGLMFSFAVLNSIIFVLSKYKCPRCQQTPLDDSSISSTGTDISYNSGRVALSPKRCRECGAYLSTKAWNASKHGSK